MCAKHNHIILNLETGDISGLALPAEQAVAHIDLSDMPDISGVNSDHDARYLWKENVTPFTPDSDYEPATKKYVDDQVIGAGFWKRTGTKLEPITANDDVDIGTGDFSGGNIANVIDDGTYIVISFGGVTLMKIRKSDGQLLIKAGVDTDAF